MKIGEAAEIIAYARGDDGRAYYVEDINDSSAEAFSVRFVGAAYSGYSLDFKDRGMALSVAWALNRTYEAGIKAAKIELRSWIAA